MLFAPDDPVSEIGSLQSEKAVAENSRIITNIKVDIRFVLYITLPAPRKISGLPDA
jgi:hypothetical protein